MQEIDKSLFPPSEDIWYAGQLKAFAARLPAIAPRYDLFAVTVLKVQCMTLEFMELLIQRMCHAADYLQHQKHAATANLQMQPELADNWHTYKALVQEFIQKLVNHIEQHTAYTAADGQALNLAALTGQAPCSASLASHYEGRY